VEDQLVSQGSNYRAFLLRLWRDDQSSPWRAQLEEAHSSQQYNFNGIEPLVEFLLAEVAGDACVEGHEPLETSEEQT